MREKPLIYAVDDTKRDRDLYRAVLEVLYDIKIFNNYEECLQAIKTEVPSVILCDLIVPSMNGWDGISAIKKLAPEINIIVATCLNNSIQCETAGIKGLKFWPKADINHLKYLIEECLTGKDLT